MCVSIRNLRWATRFWIRRLSSGSVTLAQFSVLRLDDDDEDDEDCFLLSDDDFSLDDREEDMLGECVSMSLGVSMCLGSNWD